MHEDDSPPQESPSPPSGEVVRLSRRGLPPKVVPDDFKRATRKNTLYSAPSRDESFPKSDPLPPGRGGPLNQDEDEWGGKSTAESRLPWKWPAWIGGLATLAIVWAVWGPSFYEDDTPSAVAVSHLARQTEQEAEAEAARQIREMERVVWQYLRARQIDDMLETVRFPERVAPLMEAYYQDGAIPAASARRIRSLQPLTLNQRADFWLALIEKQDGAHSSLILQMLPSGEFKVDWETAVLHQPMAWEDYVSQRPSGRSMNFRVYLEPDNFFSHEFSDSGKWTSFRLTCIGSLEPLYGYAPAGSPLAEKLHQVIRDNQGEKANVILRLNIPSGIQSRRGVVIEELLSDHWAYIEPPPPGS